MSHAVDEILDSVVLITGTANQEFGTGFAVHCEDGATWIVTCAHVVNNVGKGGKIRVRDRDAEVVCCGELEGVDLAVLRVPGLAMQPLKLEFAGRKEMACGIAGFASLKGARRRAELLDVTLGSRVVFEGAEQPRVEAWRLEIEGKTLLESGYSGSPVVCAATLSVFAVASYEESAGKRGYAVSLVHLQDVWPAMPAEWLSARSATGGALSPELHNSLEDLFQTLPISAEQLRAWCHQAMPKGKPHEISTDANRLDLLEWLIDRGRLASGQAPLLTVLRHSLGQKRMAAWQSQLHLLDGKLSVLEEQWILETRAEEKFRLQSLIDATQSEHDRIEQLLLKRAETLTESDPNEQRLLEQTTRHFGIRADQVQPEPTPAKAEETPTLLLHIWRPSPDKRCHVQGWLFYSAELHPQVCTRDADRALNLTDEQELADLLEELRERLALQGVKRHVPVEFILSMELLSQPVEQWLDEDSDPLGIKAPVVVRSRDRLLNPAWQIGWQDCWDRLLAQRDQRLQDRLWCFEADQREQVPIKLEERWCIALCFIPDWQAPHHVVRYLLRKGAPVVFWPRQEGGLDTAAQQRLCKRLVGNLKDLPESTRNMRLQLRGQKQKTDPCFHLTLLWDDPTRRPPLKPESDDEFLSGPA